MRRASSGEDEPGEDKKQLDVSEGAAAYRASVARYANMNLPQLRKLCSQSWLSEEGSEDELKRRLVEYDAAAEGWEIPKQSNTAIDVSDSAPTELEDVCLASSSEDDDAPSISANAVAVPVERSRRVKSAVTPQS